MRLHHTLLAFALISSIPVAAATWENQSLRVKIALPGTWKFISPKMSAQRIKSAKDSADIIFYGELKKRTEAGNFFVFEEKPKSRVRADLQASPMGKPIRAMNDRDIQNLCPLWAQNRQENERPFVECGPRKLGNAWTAYFVYQADPDGKTEYQIKYFRTDGTLIQLTVAGTQAQSEAIFKNTKFY